MITDRISLHIAYIYLKQFEEITGPISNIDFSKKTLFGNIPKTGPPFNNLVAFKTFIDTEAPLVAFDRLDCQPLSLYELKSLNVTIDGVNSFIYSDKGIFKTSHQNVSQVSLDVLNVSYRNKFNKILAQFNTLQFDEYILQQYTYIDCKYIFTFFNEDYQKLRELFKKYKKL